MEHGSSTEKLKETLESRKEKESRQPAWPGLAENGVNAHHDRG